MKRTQNLSTHNLTVMAALVAMQIILARFLSIQVSDILRISFESIPIMLAGLWLGPVNGAIVALVADFLGTIIHGYGAWFPPLALGPISVAVICGLGSRHILGGDLADRRIGWKLIGIVLAAGLLNSFFFGLIGSTLYSIVMKGNTAYFTLRSTPSRYRWAQCFSRTRRGAHGWTTSNA